MASAAPATVKGTFAGPGLPDTGDGVTGVRAVNAETGVVEGADYTGGKRDRWRLGVPPGPYALGASAVPFDGGKLVERLVAFVAARSGKTETLKLRLKPKKRRPRAAEAPPRAARVAEGFGDVAVDYPAIWVKHFDVQSQDPGVRLLGKGLADMLITDLTLALGTECPGAVLEREHIDAVITEQRLQQLPNFNPGTRVRQGRLIIDNGTVSGTIAESGGHLTITSTYTDRRRSPARSRTVSVQGPGESVFDLEQQLAQKLIDVICSDGLPDRYGGTFSGSSVDAESTRSWHGTVNFTRVTPPDPRAEQCDGRGVACYDVTGGTVTWETSTTPGAMCTYQSGPKSVGLTPGNGVLTVDASGSETPGYSGGFAVLDLTTGTSQCDPSPPEDQTFILTDCCMSTNAGTPWGDFGENGGLTLRGTRTTGDSTYRVTHNWDLGGV